MIGTTSATATTTSSAASSTSTSSSSPPVEIDPQLLDLFDTLTGPHKVPFGDPFWNSLLSSLPLRETLRRDAGGENPVMEHFAARLLSCNLRSGNLARLVQHTVQCLNLALQAAEGGGGGEGQGQQQGFFLLEALNGMRLTAVFVGYLLARAGGEAEMVLEHIQPFSYEGMMIDTTPSAASSSSFSYSSSSASISMTMTSAAAVDSPVEGKIDASYYTLPPPQASRNHSYGHSFSSQGSLDGKASALPSPTAPVIPALMEALCRWLLSEVDATSLPPAAKLEAVDLLLVLCSSQLYGGMGGTPVSQTQTQTQTYTQANGKSNLFLDALMQEAVVQNERAAIESTGGNTSGALGFRLVRLLLTWFMQQPTPTAAPAASGGSGGSSGSGSGATPRTYTQAITQTSSLPAPASRAGEGEGGGAAEEGANSGRLLGAISMPFRSIYSYITGSGGENPSHIQAGGEAARFSSPAGTTAALATTSAMSLSSPHTHTHTPATTTTTKGGGGGGGILSRTLSLSRNTQTDTDSATAAVTAAAGAVVVTAAGKQQAACVLGERAVLLLLLLVYNYRRRGDTNPFRDAFVSLSDERYDYDESRHAHAHTHTHDDEMLGHRAHYLMLPFDKLYAALGRHLQGNVANEQTTLLFYSLLVNNPLFLDSTLARGDVDLLFLPLLHHLYHTDSRVYIRSPRQLYVLVIVLLILTQDASFNVGLFRRHLLPSVSWYKERHLTNISLGSLVMLCVLRVLIYDLNKAKDLYLLSNCGAILLNLASQAEKIHEYTALRLCNVLVTVLRRFVQVEEKRTQQQQLQQQQQQQQQAGAGPYGHTHAYLPPPPPAAATAPPPFSSSSSSSSSSSLPTHHQPLSSTTTNTHTNTSTTSTSSPADDALTYSLLSEALRVLLSVFNICLRPSLLQQNIRLIHYLLYSRRDLEPLLAHPAVRAAVGEGQGQAQGHTHTHAHTQGGLGMVPVVMAHFGRMFDETEETLSVEKAMELLEKGARQLVSKLRAEENNSYAQTQTHTEAYTNTHAHEQHSMAKDPDLKFTYEEEADPEQFFVPYIWEVVYAQTKEDVSWVPARIRVFELPPPPPPPPSTTSAPSASSSSTSGGAGGAAGQQQSGGNSSGGGGWGYKGMSASAASTHTAGGAPPVVLTMHV